MLRRLALFVALAMMPLAGCAQDCGAVGCGPPPLLLTVHDANGLPIVGFNVEVATNGQVWSVACPSQGGADGGSPCPDGTVDLTHHVPGGYDLPDAETSIRIETEQGRSVFAFLADLQRPFFPNGQSCGPACYRSPIVVTLSP